MNDNGKQLLTHSRLSCFRTCPQKHYLRYEVGLRPEEESTALRVGRAFHRALEAEYKGEDIDAAMTECVADPYDMALVAAMFSAYHERWKDTTLEVIQAEETFNIPLTNPQTGAPTTVWQLAGKTDRIVKLADGRLALMEHKTTSRDFTPGADYWVALHLDQQLSIYVIAARELGFDVQTILYDVMRRPMLRPLKATPEADRKYTKKDGKLYANQREADELPDEFAARVAADIAERPDYYFARIEIPRLQQDLDECAWEVWQQQLAIREAQRSGRWYKNPNSCFGNFGVCEYLSICQGNTLNGEIPPGFKVTEDIHPELNQEPSAHAGRAA